MKKTLICTFLLLSNLAFGSPTDFDQNCQPLKRTYIDSTFSVGSEEWSSWHPRTCGQCAEPWGQIRCDKGSSSAGYLAYRIQWGDDYNLKGHYYCGRINLNTKEDSGWKMVGAEDQFKSEADLESAYRKCFESLN